MTTPYVLLPYQQQWLADPAPVKVMEKSRRVGISWAEAGEAALTAAAKKGMDVWYIGYNREMAQEFIRDTGGWAKSYQLVASEIEEEIFSEDNSDKAILAYVIRFASGFRVTALSSRPANLRGKQGRVIIDEAAFHEELGELLKAAMALLMWGGQVRVISTHDGVDNPFNEVVTGIREGRLPYSLHRVTLDDGLGEGLYQRICLVRGLPWSPAGEAAWRQGLIDTYGADADEELFCIPTASAGKFLPLVLLEQRMSRLTPVFRLSLTDAFLTWPEEVCREEIVRWCAAHLEPALSGIPKESRTYFGVDFGRKGDLSVVIPLMEDRQLVRRPPFVLELRNVPFREQEQVLFFVADRLPGFGGGALDSRGNGGSLAEAAYRRYGETRIARVDLTEGWYREHMPPFKAGLEDGTLTDLPRDADILDDLCALEVIKGVARVPDKRTKGKDGGQRHGDAAIALALAVYASRVLRVGPFKVEYLTLASLRDDDEDDEPRKRWRDY